ncbi:MAG: hypothetical protein RR415_00940 [Ruthenibacterium sp.]
MDYFITKSEKAEMEQFIKDHPIDPKYDHLEDVFDDWEMPSDEGLARSYRKMLTWMKVKDD